MPSTQSLFSVNWAVQGNILYLPDFDIVCRKLSSLYPNPPADIEAEHDHNTQNEAWYQGLSADNKTMYRNLPAEVKQMFKVLVQTMYSGGDSKSDGRGIFNHPFIILSRSSRNPWIIRGAMMTTFGGCDLNRKLLEFKNRRYRPIEPAEDLYDHLPLKLAEGKVLDKPSWVRVDQAWEMPLGVFELWAIAQDKAASGEVSLTKTSMAQLLSCPQLSLIPHDQMPTWREHFAQLACSKTFAQPKLKISSSKINPGKKPLTTYQRLCLALLCPNQFKEPEALSSFPVEMQRKAPRKVLRRDSNDILKNHRRCASAPLALSCSWRVTGSDSAPPSPQDSPSRWHKSAVRNRDSPLVKSAPSSPKYANSMLRKDRVQGCPEEDGVSRQQRCHKPRRSSYGEACSSKNWRMSSKVESSDFKASAESHVRLCYNSDKPVWIRQPHAIQSLRA